MFWQSVVVVCGLVNAICIALDKLPRVATRRKIHDWLEGLWLTLDGTRILKMPQLMASSTLRAVRKVFGPRWWSVRSISLTVFLSCVLTSCGLTVGSLLDFGSTENVFFILGNLNEVAVLLGINLWFDFITVLVTLYVLSKVSRQDTSMPLALILADVVMAMAISVLCLQSMLAILGEAIPVSQLRAFFLDPRSDPEGFTFVAYASTTLLPTLAYMSVLVAMLLGQLAVKLTMAYAERATDDDPRDSWAFRILGIVVAMVGALAIAVKHFAAVWTGTPSA